MTSDLMQKLEDNLIVTPPLPRELLELNPFVQCTLSHSNVISTLILMKQTGLVVREHSEIFSDATPTTSTTKKEEKKISHGCLFIPVPNFGRFFVIKTVSEHQAVKDICDQIQNQLESIKQDFENSGLSPAQLTIICLSKNAQKLRHLEDFKTSVLNNTCKHFDNIQINLKYINKDKAAKELKRVLEYRSEKPVPIASLAKYYFEKLNSECFYRPSDKKLKFANHPSFNIENIDTVQNVLNFFFPRHHHQLETIPSFNRMTDNMLFNILLLEKLETYQNTPVTWAKSDFSPRSF